MNIRNNPIGRQKSFSNDEYILLLILLLSFMDFKLYSMHLMLIAFALFCLFRGRLAVAPGVIPPLILTFALLIFWPGSVISPSAWMKRLVWMPAFLLGYGLVWPLNNDAKDVNIAEKRAGSLITVAAVGFFVHILLNLYINNGQEAGSRNTVDFWIRDSRAATGQAGIACIPLAWCVAYLFRDEKVNKKLLAIIALLAMLYYNLTLASRTMIFSFIILIAAATIFFLKRSRTNKNAIFSIVMIIAICAAVMLIYSNDVWGIRSLVEESTLTDRLGEENSAVLAEDTRWIYKLEYIKLMPDHLWGGGNIRSIVGAHAHDILLDTYDDAGLVALLAIIAILWDAIAKLLKLLRSCHFEYNTKLLILCTYIAIGIIFMVEPILDGMPWLLMSFCFLHGIVSGLVRNTSWDESVANKNIHK